MIVGVGMAKKVELDHRLKGLPNVERFGRTTSKNVEQGSSLVAEISFDACAYNHVQAIYGHL